MLRRLWDDERGLAASEKRALIVLAVVAVGALVFLLRPGGDGDSDASDRAPLPIPTQAEEVPPAAPRTTGEAFEGRDPFQPLVTEADAPPPGGGNGDGSGDGNGDGAVVDGDGDGGSDAIVVTLLDIFTSGGERMATVEVDGRTVTVGEGDRFAENFRLLTLTKRCGTFVFGDERFTLCIGQEVRK